MNNELDKNTHKNIIEYTEIISIIERARKSAFRAINCELISMYWDIGNYVSNKVKHNGWGKSTVSDFARFLQIQRPDLKGFSASNIWRMRQFYETYCDNHNHPWERVVCTRPIRPRDTGKRLKTLVFGNSNLSAIITFACP